MEIEVITREQIDGTSVDYVIIYNADGSYTSMTKATYDEQQAANANVTNEL
jgi:hypothetical protein